MDTDRANRLEAANLRKHYSSTDSRENFSRFIAQCQQARISKRRPSTKNRQRRNSFGRRFETRHFNRYRHCRHRAETFHRGKIFRRHADKNHSIGRNSRRHKPQRSIYRKSYRRHIKENRRHHNQRRPSTSRQRHDESRRRHLQTR